jgi:DNA mismatch repair protein MutS2
VDHFRAAGAFTLASTHLTALKIYGAHEDGAERVDGLRRTNARADLSAAVGLPGKSAGLDIAKRLGMPEDIMKRARASLSTQEIELSQLIADLHKRLEEATRRRNRWSASG